MSRMSWEGRGGLSSRAHGADEASAEGPIRLRTSRRLSILGLPLEVVGFALSILVAVPAIAIGRHVVSEASTMYKIAGIVRSFGPSRQFVNIAHDDIPGFRNAITMSFEPGSPGQLDQIAAGDRVVFAFEATNDGRRLSISIINER